MPSVVTKVAGVTHFDCYPRQFHKWAQLLPEHYPKCTLTRQPDNPHDPNAIRVKVGRYNVGWVPRELAARVAEYMDRGVEVTARVESIEVIPDLPNNPTMQIRIMRTSEE